MRQIFASSIFDRIFPLVRRTRCCTLPVMGSMLRKCSYHHRWSRRKWRWVEWCLRISYAPFDFIEKFFLHTWHQTMRGLWTGSAGPEIKDLVHPIFEKKLLPRGDTLPSQTCVPLSPFGLGGGFRSELGLFPHLE